MLAFFHSCIFHSRIFSAHTVVSSTAGNSEIPRSSLPRSLLGSLSQRTEAACSYCSRSSLCSLNTFTRSLVSFIYFIFYLYQNRTQRATCSREMSHRLSDVQYKNRNERLRVFVAECRRLKNTSFLKL